MQYQCDSPKHPDCNVAHARMALEAKCLRYALRQLKLAGWLPYAVHNGEEAIPATTPKAVLEEVCSVDEAVIWVRHANHLKSWVQVVLGNGIDLIPDYGTNLDDIMDTVYDHFETLA